MESETRFCQTIDRQPLFLWWELDEIVIFVSGIGLSFIFFGQATQGVVIGGIAMWLYIKFFKKKGRVGKILHYFWRRGVVNYPLLPPGYYRYFWE